MNATRLYRILFGAFLSAYAIASTAQGKIVVNDGNVVLQNSVYVVTTDVSVTSAGLMKVDTSTIKISGTITSSNNIDVRTGTVEMNGSSTQTIPANVFKVNKIKNLIISNQVNLLGEDSLTGVLSFGGVNSKTFNTGGYLTLKSDINGTASVADMTNQGVNSGNTVTGNVNAERYLTAIKKWRFLTVPTASSQTIRQAWQENCGVGMSCLPGFGTQITSPLDTMNGFDLKSFAPSMKIYNATTGVFDGVPNTLTTPIDSLINNTVGYFVFVRGDRASSTTASPVTSTVLRTRGPIKQGNQPDIKIDTGAATYTTVGNPYASRIDLRKMTPAPTDSTKIYVWDPLLSGLYGFGAYQTLTFDGSDFTVTPGGGSYALPVNQNPNYIESGHAFFVGGNDSSSYNISFREEIKPSVSNLLNVPVRIQQFISANLLGVANGATTLLDGARAEIKTTYSNKVNNSDARKILNASENVSINRDGKLLSVERYKTITDTDTFRLQISNVRVQKYQWAINMQYQMVQGMQAYLEDNYKASLTPLSQNAITSVPFTVENVKGSYAADRFMIVFKRNESQVKFSFVKVDALRKPAGINIEWRVTGDSLINRYLVERSADKKNFYTVYQIPNTNWRAGIYEWIDKNAKGESYTYRIQGINESNEIAYSKVVEIVKAELYGEVNVSVYPNPIVNGIINLQLTNQPAGTYQVRLLNILGEEMMRRKISHAGGSQLHAFNIKGYLPRGVYTIETSSPDHKATRFKIVY